MTRADRVQLRVQIIAWLIGSGLAWRWWLEPANQGSRIGLIVNSALLLIEFGLLPLWFYFWIWRMRRPDPALDAPDLRVAMIVTKAPSEPWPLVRETLEAMLDQDFPHPYAVWLADERPEPQTLRWCAAHGVAVSSREGVAEYHRSSWPRRTRCKEGNLAYFYDHWGYDLYDVVVQLDADHAPDPDYLRHMVIPFHDPAVGYVAAPSICDRNAHASWSARARLYAEAVLHGPIQSGHSGGCAPSCIGSHYAVRTRALREIGGLGPELAEDFTTTLMMSSYRWHGVFAIDAHAHGDGPATVNDCITQEFQWSRSMMNVLLRINGRYWRGLSRAAKARLGFCQLWYPLFALLMLASVLIPLVAIFTRTPMMRVSLGAFYAHFGPPTLVLLVTAVWLRRLRFLRPSRAKTLCWEVTVFQLVRWPWVLLGCMEAVVGRLSGREFEFKITPKGRSGPTPLPGRIVLPYLCVALVSALPMILHVDAGAANGYYTLALINVGLYLATAAAVIVLHIHEHPPRLRRAALSSSGGAVGLALGAVVIVLGVGALPAVVNGHRLAAASASEVQAAAVGPALQLGVATRALASNSSVPWQPRDLREVNRFDQAARDHAAIVMWFADWKHARLSVAQLRAVAARGSIPEITWEPWDSTVPVNRPQPSFTLRSIVNGRHDAYVKEWARRLHAYGRPVLLRFAQEMNGTWYPWSEGVNTNRRGEFVRAWRHVHDLFVAAGATNVRWVWSPVAERKVDISEFPGPGYVDVLGVSGFNGGAALPWSGWRSFRSLFDPTLAQLHSLARSLPIQVSEVGSPEAGGDKAAWITAMFADVRAHRAITSLVWFEVKKETDWPITSSSRAARAFAAGLRGSTSPTAMPAGGRVSLSMPIAEAPARWTPSAPWLAREPIVVGDPPVKFSPVGSLSRVAPARLRAAVP